MAISAWHAPGAIGIWHFFSSLEKYVDGLKEMVDVVGVDHVCIGTDQLVAGLAAGNSRRGALVLMAHLRVAAHIGV